MTKKDIFKKAHAMTKEFKRKYTNIDYKSQFALCLKFILKEIKKVKASMQKMDLNQIKEMLLSVRNSNLKQFDVHEYNRLKEKSIAGLCSDNEKYKLAQLTSYILPLETSQDVKAYIDHTKQIEALKKACIEAIEVQPIEEVREEKKGFMDVLKGLFKRKKKDLINA